MNDIYSLSSYALNIITKLNLQFDLVLEAPSCYNKRMLFVIIL